MILACDESESTAVYLGPDEVSAIKSAFIVSALELAQSAAELRQVYDPEHPVHDLARSILQKTAAISSLIEQRQGVAG
ncbi:hypothetical protein [Planctomyces sp. SH-PL14]|uniref:hypothetical protein n=1 Tax=Planctomyces sp. SH-PL14 TaxID=1632864 RepID=UPI00078B96D0|nr:hypothetical protein [Planctomyces sp. SH-PL14]AMV18199.1 hypothetical protein VT03_09945 [Planctomyces sp. SH-PL14]